MAQAMDDKTGEDKQWRSVQRGGPACDACRSRKTRCTPSTEPEGGPCAYCNTAGIACSFAPRVRGPPRTYLEALELRLETTQELLRNLSTSAGVDLVSLANHPSEPDSAQKLQKAIKALQQAEAERNNAPFGLPPPQHFQPPSRRIAGVFEGRFAGKSAGPALAAQVLDDHCEGATIQVGEQVSLVEHLIGRGEDRVSSASFALPPVELVQLLVDAYFSQFNNQLPVLHRPSFNRALFGGKADVDPGFRSLLFVVLALGARWAQDSRIRGDWSAKALYAASCCESPVGEHASARSTLFDLQASTLAVVHLLGAETSVQAWSTGGLAMRKFVDAGAHLETTEWWIQSPLIDQLRKRAFHLLFTFDRFCSATLGRPLAIQDSDFDLQHPIAIDDEALDRWEDKSLGTPTPAPSQDPSGLFEHFSKVAAILGRTLDRLYSPRSASLSPQEMHPIITELKAEHDACLAAVPEHLAWEYSGPNALATLVGRATLRGSSCAARLAMIRPFILRVARTRDSSLDLLEGAFILGGHATRTWNNIMRVLLDKDLVHQCFFWIPGSAGYACIVAYHILRSLLVSGRYLLSVTEGLHTAIRALQKLNNSTPEAAWCFESCKMLAQHVNRWRAAENFDYSSFLLSPDPAPIALYLNIPPFCYDDATSAALHHQSLSDPDTHPQTFINPPPAPMNDFSTQFFKRSMSPFDTLEAERRWNEEHYPFRKQDWVDLIGDSFPAFPPDLIFGNEQFEWPDDWPARDTQWPETWVQGL